VHLVTSFVNGRVLCRADPLHNAGSHRDHLDTSPRKTTGYEGFPSHTYEKQRSVGHLAMLWRKTQVCIRAYRGWHSPIIATFSVALHL
jgi:hypothetical protein